jgi:hypothetical protein
MRVEFTATDWNGVVAVGNSVELAVNRWAAWAPGVADAASWNQWARGEGAIKGPVRPDVSFVASLQRRRLSDVSRMAFAVAEQCLDEVEPRPGLVFCSRYGEYPRSFEILQGLARQEPASPTAFSMSVHNTAASQFSMHRRDHSPYTALAAGETTLETAFVEAWSQIVENTGNSVAVVYHDQPLPALYRHQETSVTDSLALGMLLSLPSSDGVERTLRLTWRPSRTQAPAAREDTNPVLAVIRLLLLDGSPVTQDTGRLVWTWSGRDARL